MRETLLAMYFVKPFIKLAKDKHKFIFKDLKREIIPAPSSIALFSLWEKLLEEKEHTALIVDE